MGIVELIDLEAAVEDRNIPFEEVDEDPLAGLEHGPEHMVGGPAGAAFDDRHC